MIDIEIMQDASEIIHYDSNKLPYAIQERLLSQFTGHKALCHWHPDIECIRIYEGSMNYEINGEQILLRAGDIILSTPVSCITATLTEKKTVNFA